MGGRFGKYGDLKRRKALQRGRREKAKRGRVSPMALRNRNALLPAAQRSSLLSATKTYWQPLRFTLTHIYLIRRNDPSDDVFRIGSMLSLGGQ